MRNVIDNLDLQIPEGKIVGLLGPNGCGKSTLIKMAAGLLQPTSGEILICGQPVSEATNSLISYLPERTYFDSSMQVSQLIGFFEEFYSDFDRARTLHMPVSYTHLDVYKRQLSMLPYLRIVGPI